MELYRWLASIPSNREWVEDGISGFLFEDGDSGQLAAKLLAIEKNRNQLTVIGRQAQSVPISGRTGKKIKRSC